MSSDSHHAYLQPAYVLHARPYRDTSVIVDLLTPEFGRISAVARGVRQAKKSKKQLLSPFHRLLVNWQGKSDMKLITSYETDHHFLHLEARHLYSAFYINELLVRLLPEHDALTGLFERYEATLYAFHLKRDIEPMLRDFERELLEGLGYGIAYDVDCQLLTPIRDDAFYGLDVQRGFFLATEQMLPETCLLGRDINALARRDYDDLRVRTLAKKINRVRLRPLLGRRPLKSRELFGPF